MGVKGRQGAAGLGESDFGACLEQFVNDTESGWLYTDNNYEYFRLEDLKALFDAAGEEGLLINGTRYYWEDFLLWWNNHDQNKYFRTPLPDGVGVLLVLSLLCALFTFLRSRDKKAEAVEEQQS